MISEAAESVFDDNLRDLHISRLENDVFLFKSKGIHEEAEMALHYARELKKDMPVCDIPFVQEIFRPTFEPYSYISGGVPLHDGMRVIHSGSNPDLEFFRG